MQFADSDPLIEAKRKVKVILIKSESDIFTGAAVMGSSPPRGVFTSNPQNCSPASVTIMVGDKIVKRILGVMVMMYTDYNGCDNGNVSYQSEHCTMKAQHCTVGHV